jgi:hypothetical protein
LVQLQRRDFATKHNPLDAIFDPHVKLGNVIASKCKVMNSKKAPLWLVFETTQPPSGEATFLFKVF